MGRGMVPTRRTDPHGGTAVPAHRWAPAGTAHGRYPFRSVRFIPARFRGTSPAVRRAGRMTSIDTETAGDDAIKTWWSRIAARNQAWCKIRADSDVTTLNDDIVTTAGIIFSRHL